MGHSTHFKQASFVCLRLRHTSHKQGQPASHFSPVPVRVLASPACVFVSCPRLKPSLHPPPPPPAPLPPIMSGYQQKGQGAPPPYQPYGQQPPPQQPYGAPPPGQYQHQHHHHQGPPPQGQQQHITVVQTENETYCGPISWIIGLFLFPCICFCPVDSRPTGTTIVHHQ
ncbi:hypothetical protein PTSG_05594 [Salpingoeca rosetta]|uniref:Uncharacterized protein n=1 Tax=Salpingoeca rosetta (strain ATCC 50818 / BSB-021) TaxID=946362 RepID=F2UBN3_SALR5|nr:uncharacterized protein PTSG_05594 [Salpingoeca rosetta]EGD73899.1 hypothetical protein PTSG_05594 [Salpingoeca rosetta]|eukprot:XP_004993462.1 hypothetical protein PTSG_05594 [Salpingoeca rosetta]